MNNPTSEWYLLVIDTDQDSKVHCPMTAVPLEPLANGKHLFEFPGNKINHIKELFLNNSFKLEDNVSQSFIDAIKHNDNNLEEGYLDWGNYSIFITKRVCHLLR